MSIFIADSAGDNLDKIENFKHEKPLVPFNIPFLDDALGGIHEQDLVILAARSGKGKTEIATRIALEASKAGNKVLYVALEEEPRGIESRVLFQRLANRFYKEVIRKKGHPDYQDWRYGRQVGLFEDFYDEELALCKEDLKNMFTVYKTKTFTIEEVEKLVDGTKESIDFYILDHLHYVDSSSDRAEANFTEIIKKLRAINLQYKKPILALCHVRKSDKRFYRVLPDIEDVHGSSDIFKTATKVILSAPLGLSGNNSYEISTLLHAAKCRTRGSVVNYTACMKFDLRTNSYCSKYRLVSVNDEGVLSDIEPVKYPFWAENRLEKKTEELGRVSLVYS